MGCMIHRQADWLEEKEAYRWMVVNMYALRLSLAVSIERFIPVHITRSMYSQALKMIDVTMGEKNPHGFLSIG